MPTDPMTLTDEELTALRSAQFHHTAITLLEANRYFSDSVYDPVTAALDAADMIHQLVYDNDRTGLARWIADTTSGPTTYCSEGLCRELLRLLPDEED